MRLSQSIAILLLPLKAMACGLDWSEPVSHFPNVDYQGNVHIVRKLGEVEKLPIYLIFNSSYGTSPYAGSGFEIPLLESRIWQVDENRFQMKSPSGWLWIFQRTRVPNVLEGNAGWKGLIKDDSITVWAPCGDKIVFKNGRIDSMKLKDKVITYKYQNGQVLEIQDGNTPILKVEKAPITGEVTGFTLPNNQKIQIEHGSRPRVQVARDQQLICGVEPSLNKISKADGKVITFDYAVDKSLNPTVKIDDRLIVWSPTIKTIISDGDLVYDVQPIQDYFANAAIGRSDVVNGHKEFWFLDPSHGTETVLFPNGVVSKSQWFTSGIFSGRLRKITQSNGKQIAEVYNASYDEKGRLLREKHRSLTYVYHYDDNSDDYSCSIFRSNKLISTMCRSRTNSGFVDKIFNASGDSFETRISPLGHIVALSQ